MLAALMSLWLVLTTVFLTLLLIQDRGGLLSFCKAVSALLLMVVLGLLLWLP